MTILKTVLVMLIAMAGLAGPLAAADKKDGAEGVWLTKEGKSHVKIIECGNQLCNEIVWLKQPLNSKGVPHTDKLNQVKSLRDRPIIGLSVLTNAKKQSRGYWRGRIYDPERGKSFLALITLIDSDKLQVQGCLSMGPPFCQTHVWKKIASVEDYENPDSVKNSQR